MIKLLRGVVAVLALTHAGVAQTPTRFDTLAAFMPIRSTMLWDSKILTELDSIADHSAVETARCILGVYMGMDVVMDVSYAPKVLMATNINASFEGCPVSTVMFWHLHPPPPGIEPTKLCYLSAVDLENAVRAVPRAGFQMVHVKKGVYCWWSVAQVLEYVQTFGFAYKLPAAPGQTSW